MRTIYIDTETTGLVKFIHGIISLSYIIDDENDHTIAKGKIEMNPLSYGAKITQEALVINGYSEDQITEFDDAEFAISQFIKLCNQHQGTTKYKVIGYNVQFDVGFIQEWFRKLNRGQYGYIFDYKTVDPFELVKYLQHVGAIDMGKSQSLGNACKYFDIELENAHDSDDDIRATRELYLLLRERIGYEGSNS